MARTGNVAALRHFSLLSSRTLQPQNLPHSPIFQTNPTATATTIPRRTVSVSAVTDALADFLSSRSSSSKKKRQRQILDEKALDATHLVVTRLNDARAGSRASLLDAIAGPAAGDVSREDVRRRRVGSAWKDLLARIPEGDGGGGSITGTKRDEVASVLSRFELKEVGRRERLRQSLEEWRDGELSSLDAGETSDDGGFFSRQFSKFFGAGRERRRRVPDKTLKEQFENERDLFRGLRDAGIDLDTVKTIVGGVSALAGTTDHGGDRRPPSSDETRPRFVHVLDFTGDARASKAPKLASEISAVLSLPPDLRPVEVILRLKSPGGTVTGYGRCAAELRRLRSAGIALTACVDEMAASGGYLMASVADNIYASPFAAVGSIGVVASTPNVAQRLNEEGIKFESTAGKYKRTVTPWREPEPYELEKMQEDVDTIQRHFVAHVDKYRRDRIPDHVGGAAGIATGEVWFGEDALSRGIVDDLMTSEEYISSRMEEGFELLHIDWKPPSNLSLPTWLSAAADVDGTSVVGSPMLEHRISSMGTQTRKQEDELMFASATVPLSDESIAIAKSLPINQRQALIRYLLMTEGK